jgi:oxygen-dependent protoporphyrinogen oxidase
MSGPVAARHVVVVGGGIAGLAAAAFLRAEAGPDLRVTVLEAAGRIGGKLRLIEVAGLTLDGGAEALLARRPEAVDLVRRVGLGDDLVHPATTRAGIWTRGMVRPLPRGHVFGIPTDLRAAARGGVLSAPGLARAAAERLLPRQASTPDVALGRFVRDRWGAEVLDRLVDPLIGGVYAGRADQLSLDAVAPQLATAFHEGRRVSPPEPVARAGPVFAGIRGGVGRLPAAVAAACGAEIRTGVTVRQMEPSPEGWRLVTGSAGAPTAVLADAVVLAVPASAAVRLLAHAVPAAAAELATIEYASVAIVTLVLPAAVVRRPLRGSGFLVPAIDRRLIKAVTYSCAKWDWTARAAGEGLVLRASVGRVGDTTDLAHDDAELTHLVRADLERATGLRGDPLGSAVTRWGGALPQYAVGHSDRVARVRAAVAAVPGLAVCGAAYDGIGIAACVASARKAAAAVLAGLPSEAELVSGEGTP